MAMKIEGNQDWPSLGHVSLLSEQWLQSLEQGEEGGWMDKKHMHHKDGEKIQTEQKDVNTGE